jgi:hypothetical protein
LRIAFSVRVKILIRQKDEKRKKTQLIFTIIAKKVSGYFTQGVQEPHPAVGCTTPGAIAIATVPVRENMAERQRSGSGSPPCHPGGSISRKIF